MSFTRRIAKSALLTAAGAASVVGAAAGSAHAVQLPTTDLGGVSNLDNLDTENVGEGVDSAARNVTELAGHAGGEAVEQTVPAAGRTVGSLGKSTLPMAQRATGAVAGESGALLGKAVTSVTDNGLPTDQVTSLAPVGASSLGGGSIAGLPLG
ncbi:MULTISPECIES: ATP-binding protein [Streptomyces]|uniref:ATP-binding protein n=1 Tax=Streptomyces TaxID=1883 RepID=UPI002248DED7|nr:ATP-binding protein [Streptomyces sp. JHD 1]MCX2969678.1 ATP-binding protein [Streptomyces sp. JHD 1]